MRNLIILTLACFCTVVLSTSCGKSGSPSSGSTASQKTLYWIQPMKGHPVHQMTQIAFREGCRKAGYTCVVIGSDEPDIAGTIALAEQVLTKGDAAGLAVWAADPSWHPFIEKASKRGIPIIIPHFPKPEKSVPGATGVISCDPKEYARIAAQEIGKAIQGKGAVAITQGSFNTTENMVAEVFTSTMKELYPNVRVLKPDEEGFDSARAISKATSLLQANPDVVAALSTTGGGPSTWAGAQKETGRKIIAVGMDYTRINLDMVKNGTVFAVIGQPLWEESFGAAELLAKAAQKKEIDWWTKLPAPFITKNEVASYDALLDKVEAALAK